MLNKFLAKLYNKICQNLNWTGENRSIFQFGSLFSCGVFVVSITARCNFSCPHCLRDYNYKKDSTIKDIPISVFETILREGRKINFKWISLSGGEPILHPQFEKLIELIVRYGYRFNFTTNGWFYDKYWFVLNQYRKNLELIFLSLDGATAEVHDSVRDKPGSFDRAIEAAKFFKENNVPIVVSTVFTKKNYHQLEEMVNLCLRLGVRRMKCGAVLSPYELNDLTLTNKERIELIRKILNIQKKLGNSFRLKATASLLEGGEFLEGIPGYKRLIDFCATLGHELLYIDQEGGVLPCCDIYREYKNKPIIQKNGFEECLRTNMDLINEIKKQRLHDLLYNSKDVYRTCSYCSKYFEKYLNMISRKEKL